MAHMKIVLAFIGLAIASAHAYGAQYVMGYPASMVGMGYSHMGMMGGAGGYSGLAGFGTYNPMGVGMFDSMRTSRSDNSLEDNLRLTCLHNNTDFRGYLTDALAVTISRREDDSSGLGQMQSMDPFSFASVNQRQNQRRGSLKATIQLLSSAQGTGTIVFTKTARVEAGCLRETMGAIHTPSNRETESQGFNTMGFGMMDMLGDSSDENAGIVKDNIQINFNLQTIYIDRLKGFSDLSELAGRGVAVCSETSTSWDFQTECSGPMFGCCTLKYDDKDVALGLDSFEDSNEYNSDDPYHHYPRSQTTIYS